jgi:predicted amidohydrolase YtcJ
MRRTLAAAGACLASIGCVSTPQDEPRDVLITGGRIYLGAPDWRAVEGLLVRDGVVVAAGAPAELAKEAREPETLDLGGAIAIPGLQDAHGHLESLGASLESIDLRGCASYDEVVARVAARAASTPKGEWLLGRGWDQNLWPVKEFPLHGPLSAATPDHPVLLERVDGHATLANALAMQIAGVDRPFESETSGEGGRVLLDAERRPTGVFVDDACKLVESAVPPPDSATRERRILAAQERLLSLGLTAVHDMGISWKSFDVLQELSAGELQIRCIEYLSATELDDATRLASAREGQVQRDGLFLAGVKLYADGALGSRGAALLAPYADEPSHAGLTLMSREDLARAVDICAEHGLQPAVHAIGDRANREVLDVYEARMRRDPDFARLRPRIEHAQVVASEDWPRFDRLGVIASMQPTHATSDMPWAPDRLGPERVEGAYAWRRLSGDPARLAFGSDFPVESPDPLAGLYAAITCRRSDGTPADGFRPDQRLSATEALSAFTWGAARACRQEDRRGRLFPGYAADLTVLDVDPVRCAPDELLRARVKLTIVDGRVVWSAPPGE